MRSLRIDWSSLVLLRQTRNGTPEMWARHSKCVRLKSTERRVWGLMYVSRSSVSKPCRGLSTGSQAADVVQWKGHGHYFNCGVSGKPKVKKVLLSTTKEHWGRDNCDMVKCVFSKSTIFAAWWWWIGNTMAAISWELLSNDWSAKGSWGHITWATNTIIMQMLLLHMFIYIFKISPVYTFRASSLLFIAVHY